MNTLAAQEVKRRGISAVDEVLKNGPVHIIKNNQPQYVVMTEQRYRELVEAEGEAYTARIAASLKDLKSGKVRRFKSADDLIRALKSEDRD